MTRFLRAALGALEPTFSQSIRQLEQAAGAPSADIRLTTEVVQQVKAKISELGLDPTDTTGPELYHALHERLDRDEKLTKYCLGIPVDSPPQAVVSRVQQFLTKHDMPQQCFALKTSVLKKMLKAKPPKTAMKRLGYRSVESMLKHEVPAQLFAAAFICESPSWRRNFANQYGKLMPSDFESRHITFVVPKSKKWQDLADSFAAKQRTHILAFRELGTIILLPVQQDIDGLTITSLMLALDETNGIRAFSSFIKMQQVKPNFGRLVQQWADTEPLTSASMAGKAVPWRMIQQFYATFTKAYNPELFEPHVQPEDLQWYKGEEALAKLAPALHFWQGTAMLALLHEDEPVSLNILDVAVSHANHLPYGDRVVHFFRDHLWHELMMRYLHQENLERAVREQLAGDLIDDKKPEGILAS